ncbi:MAG: endonuclease/exonuclease/phosphatase family protein [Acidobacteriota bacterium]|nr:endonuclease/exonuclease/phosphatase family protein [Acidobacteriota bacterium]
MSITTKALAQQTGGGHNPVGRAVPEIKPGTEPAIELGSFADVATPTAAGRTRIVVVTFNIRYGVGSFLITGSLLRRVGVKRPGRRAQLVAANIERAARALTTGELMPPADLIALQEADRGTRRAGLQHVARELAQSLKMNYAHAASPTPLQAAPKPKQWYLDFEEHIEAGEAGATGVALLSRLLLERPRRIELPWSECVWRPRLAVAASVKVGSQRIHFFNSHIDPHADVAGQLAQHEAILADAQLAGAGDATVLLGDFNTLTPPSRRATRRLLEDHGYTTPLPTGLATWRAGLYRLHADWIFVRGARVTRFGVARPLSVSDHWPVWAEIELNDAKAGAR